MVQGLAHKNNQKQQRTAVESKLSRHFSASTLGHFFCRAKIGQNAQKFEKKRFRFKVKVDSKCILTKIDILI